MGAKKIKPPPKTRSKTILVQDTPAERLKIWAEKNKMALIVVAAAIFFPLLSNWGMGAYREHNENTARTEFAAIASKLPSEGKSTPEQWQKLIPDLQKFISKHKGTQSALVSQIELAKAFYETKLYDEAIKAGQDALKAVPPGDGLKPLVQYQLAFAYEAAGKMDQALKEWTGLKESGAMGMDREADWRIGKIYAAGKDYAKAAEMYSKALQAPGNYPAQPMMEEELARTKLQAGKTEPQPPANTEPQPPGSADKQGK